jgi:hypothetical protein
MSPVTAMACWREPARAITAPKSSVSIFASARGRSGRPLPTECVTTVDGNEVASRGQSFNDAREKSNDDAECWSSIGTRCAARRFDADIGVPIECQGPRPSSSGAEFGPARVTVITNSPRTRAPQRLRYPCTMLGFVNRVSNLDLQLPASGFSASATSATAHVLG